MALEKRVFSNEEFQSWGKENAVLFAAVMTRIAGRKDDDLLSKYGFRGFPSLAVLDASGKAIVKNFGRSLSAMKDAVERSGDFLEMRAKVAAGGEYDKKAWFLLQLKLDQLKGDEALEGAAKLGLKGAEAKAIDSKILAIQVTELMSKEAPANGAKIYKWLAAGRRLNDDADRGAKSYVAAKAVIGAMAANDAKIFKLFESDARRMHDQQVRRVESILPRVDAARARFAGQPAMLDRIEKDVKTFKAQLAESKKALADMKVFAAKLEKTDAGK